MAWCGWTLLGWILDFFDCWDFLGIIQLGKRVSFLRGFLIFLVDFHIKWLTDELFLGFCTVLNTIIRRDNNKIWVNISTICGVDTINSHLAVSVANALVWTYSLFLCALFRITNLMIIMWGFFEQHHFTKLRA